VLPYTAGLIRAAPEYFWSRLRYHPNAIQCLSGSAFAPRPADPTNMPQFPLTSRRGFFRSAVALVPPGTLAACVLKSSGTSAPDSNKAASGPQASGVDYKPHFFDTKEWAFIHAAVDRLIPADSEGPRGVEAGVPEFIDRQMDTPYAHGALWYIRRRSRRARPNSTTS
jgi:gluconate 2-dehydrogenase gamma chain